MSEILTNNKYYKDIADTIRQMKGVATTYKPREMAGALREMYSTEVEGVPPLTFPSNGNNLLNYRIDGANGGVGDRTANLLDYNWLFDYEQKKVNEYFNYIQITLEPNTTYNVTSDYDYNKAQNATAFIVVNSNTAITTANGGVFGSLTVTTTQDGILKIARRIKGNNEAMIPKREDFENNSKHIQISINSVNDENYEPYGYKIPVVCGGTTTNIYIDEPIGANESKSLSDTNVNIPTINGTNILSIGTTVQPSNVYVQAPKTNNYNL